MTRRIHPDGPGWVRVYDRGDTVAWLRPSLDGLGVEAVVWMYNYWAEGSTRPWEVWTVYEPTPVTRLDDIVFNKAHRVRHLADPDRLNPTWLDGEAKDPADLAHEEAIIWSVRQVGPPTGRRHRRRNWNRDIYLGRVESSKDASAWNRHVARMPRKIRKALYG